jgi:hypothetical protein
VIGVRKIGNLAARREVLQASFAQLQLTRFDTSVVLYNCATANLSWARQRHTHAKNGGYRKFIGFFARLFLICHHIEYMAI